MKLQVIVQQQWIKIINKPYWWRFSQSFYLTSSWFSLRKNDDEEEKKMKIIIEILVIIMMMKVSLPAWLFLYPFSHDLQSPLLYVTENDNITKAHYSSFHHLVLDFTCPTPQSSQIPQTHLYSNTYFNNCLLTCHHSQYKNLYPEFFWI